MNDSNEFISIVKLGSNKDLFFNWIQKYFERIFLNIETLPNSKKIFIERFFKRSNSFFSNSLRWLNKEIASLNRQIRSAKEQLFYVIHPEKNFSTKQRNKNPLKRKPSLLNRNHSKVNISSIPVNQRNLQILQILTSDPLFDGFISQLIDIYRRSPIRTIECVAMIVESKSQSAFLFIKTSNGEIDFYPIDANRTLKQTYVRMIEPISNWNDENKQILYYRRFLPERSSSSLSLTDQYAEIKSKKNSSSSRFFSKSVRP